MSGAGSSAAGLGAAGMDVFPTSAPPLALTYPRAVLFDLATKTFVQASDGTFVDVHPVDQAVALALAVVLGSIAAAPAMGHALNTIQRHTAKTPGDVDRIVRAALKLFVDAGDIDLRRITPTFPQAGRMVVEVEYFNNRTKTLMPLKLS